MRQSKGDGNCAKVSLRGEVPRAAPSRGDRTSSKLALDPRAMPADDMREQHCFAIASNRTLASMMLDPQSRRNDEAQVGPPLDFQAHLAALEQRGLLVRIDRPINKDTELHPLVRWQFQGGLPEDERRAFLFTNVTDGAGRRYDIPVAVGALAASPAIYAIGMGRPVDEIGAAWLRAMAHPIAPGAASVPAGPRGGV